jgi:hypothetical protein
MKQALFGLVLLGTAASLWSAPRPAPSGPQSSITVTLAKDPGNDPIGVEPQGGRFLEVIKHGEDKGHVDFWAYSPYSKAVAAPYELAIYASSQSRIPLEKPLARITLTGSTPKKKMHLVHVEMTHPFGRKLLISAGYVDSHRQLVAEISSGDEPTLAPVGAGPGPTLSPIAAGPVAGLKEYIGVRRAGGIFVPLLHLGDTPGTEGTASFSASIPGQKSVDVTIFATKRETHYIERTESFDRYLISGFKENAPAKNKITLTLKVEPGNRITASATDTATGTLHVAKYSTAELERLQAAGQLGQGQVPESEFPSLIPSR